MACTCTTFEGQRVSKFLEGFGENEAWSLSSALHVCLRSGGSFFEVGKVPVIKPGVIFADVFGTLPVAAPTFRRRFCPE